MADQVNILSVPITESLDDMHVLVDQEQTGEPYRIPADIFFQAAASASDAATQATNAATAAGTATTQANAARDAANAAATSATNATSSANSARDAANAAANMANAATTQANSARDAANTAAGAANTAASAANQAADNTAAAISAANTAASTASAAAGTANTAALAANTAADNANTAAANTQSAVDAANTAADRANTAAQIAEQASYLAPGLPQIEIRVKRSRQPVTSTIFTNETNSVLIDELEFKLVGSPAQCNALASNGYTIVLMRPKRSHKSDNKRKWSVIDDARWSALRTGGEYPQTPTRSFTSLQEIKAPYWAAGISIEPITIPANYSGGWLPFPYTMEQIIRRYIYFERVNFSVSPKIKTVLNPSDTFRPTFTPSTSLNRLNVHWAKIANTSRRQAIWGIPVGGQSSPTYQNLLQSAGQTPYISIPLGIACAQFNNDDPSKQRWIYGPPTKFTGFLRWAGQGVTPAGGSFLQYTAKLSGSGKPKTDSRLTT